MITSLFANVFTVGRSFALMLALIFGCFLWSGGESVMTKLGFETKTALVQKLAKETQTRQQLEQTNKDLVVEVTQAKKDHDRVVQALDTLNTKNQHIEAVTQRITESLSKKSQEAKNTIEKKKVVTTTTISLPVAEVNALSQANIDSLHDAFDQLNTNGEFS